jgi:glycosyltransferase involved in cell wall biosynthesis
MWSNSIPSHLIWPLSKLAASKAKLVAVSSSRVMDFCKAAGIPPEKIRITKFYTFSVDKNERKETEALRIKERLGYRKTVLFMGRLLEGKGVEYLIRAFARFSDKSIGLLIVGDGPDRNRLEKLCVELSLHNVVFAGFVYNEITRDAYYLLSDILVLPSITQNVHEEWGVVVNEAMSVGKPVIVTSSVGCAFELVRNGVNGYIVPEKNVEALYEALETLLVNDELRAQMGEASKRIVDNEFTYANEIESVKRLFQDAFGNL